MPSSTMVESIFSRCQVYHFFVLDDRKVFRRNRLLTTYAYTRFHQQLKQYKDYKHGTLPATYNDWDKPLNMVLKCLLQESNNNLSFNDRYTKKSDIFNLKHTFFHIYEITVKTQEGVSFFYYVLIWIKIRQN